MIRVLIADDHPLFRAGIRRTLEEAGETSVAGEAATGEEVIQLLHRWPNGTWLVQTRHSLGWIPSDAPLSPPVPPAALQGLVHGPQAIARADLSLTDGSATASVPEGTLLPLVSGTTDRVTFATSSGLHESAAVASLLPTSRPLTARSRDCVA